MKKSIGVVGAGTWGMPMRVGTDCEVVFIRLMKQP